MDRNEEFAKELINLNHKGYSRSDSFEDWYQAYTAYEHGGTWYVVITDEVGWHTVLEDSDAHNEWFWSAVPGDYTEDMFFPKKFESEVDAMLWIDEYWSTPNFFEGEY